jgi:hypothetical protein
MSNVTLFGFPRSTFVKVCGLILTAKGVDYRFHDTEDEMYLPIHLSHHPFGRVPGAAARRLHAEETNAIASYIDDVFPGPKLTPDDPQKRARMNQWIGNLNWYFYPEMIYHTRKASSFCRNSPRSSRGTAGWMRCRAWFTSTPNCRRGRQSPLARVAPSGWRAARSGRCPEFQAPDTRSARARNSARAGMGAPPPAGGLSIWAYGSTRA